MYLFIWYNLVTFTILEFMFTKTLVEVFFTDLLLNSKWLHGF